MIQVLTDDRISRIVPYQERWLQGVAMMHDRKRIEEQIALCYRGIGLVRPIMQLVDHAEIMEQKDRCHLSPYIWPALVDDVRVSSLRTAKDQMSGYVYETLAPRLMNGFGVFEMDRMYWLSFFDYIDEVLGIRTKALDLVLLCKFGCRGMVPMAGHVLFSY